MGKPIPSWRKGKKFAIFVYNPKTHRTNVIHFGDTRYRHNYSEKARRKFLARSSGIRNKKGQLTKNNPMYANYWARRVLWGKKKY